MAKTFSAHPFRMGKTSVPPPCHRFNVAPPPPQLLTVFSDQSLNFDVYVVEMN